MDFLDTLIDDLDTSLRDDCDSNVTFGNIIKDGYDSEVDELRDILAEGSVWISNYSHKLSQELGQAKLKIKYTGNLGYFIELPKQQKVEAEFMIHKQSLQNVARYTTLDLQEYEQKLQSAEENLREREYELFLKIRDSVLTKYNNLIKLSRDVAYFDFLYSGATLSLEKAWNSPEISKNNELTIISGKHPVLEDKVDEFISNSLEMTSQKRVHIITGPNMGGKSTFLRQNALLIILAHMGYDIPAVSAKIPLTDAIFSRVGAGDNLFMGQSTFMVEMQEVAYILRRASKKSFIIVDEVGRGTSTYDGVSLAWAILKYIHNEIHAKLLFATHYHEIIDYSQSLSGCENFSVAVGENSENLVFLRKIIPGGMKKSYGIEVAKIAGIPDEVLHEARVSLKSFQTENIQQYLDFGSHTPEKSHHQTDICVDMCSNLQEMSLDHVTPFQALEILHDLKEQLKNSN